MRWTVNLDLENAYLELKSALNKKGYRIVVDEPDRHCPPYGALWGITPRAAKKTTRYDLAPTDCGTQILASEISSDWTVGGYVRDGLLAVFCFWIGTDLESFIATNQSTFWS